MNASFVRTGRFPFPQLLPLALSATLLWQLTGTAAEPPLAARLEIDDSAPAREAKLSASYAPVVTRVAPSVVSIFTTKRVANPRLEELFPFSDDPMLRRWFGDEFGGGSRSRPQFRKERGLGSGVIVTKDGYILSNHHVVAGADEIKIALVGDKKQFTARVVGRDPQTDLALLKIDATGLAAITLTDSGKLQVGDVVLAVGNPFGVGQSVSHGIISAVGRGGLGIETYEDFIQTDAAINPGNSGGALVDAQGRLVGINTAIASRTGSSSGVGFAVPVNLARRVMEQLLKEGKVVRGFLGVVIQDLTPELAREFDLPDGKGALIGSVEPQGAAAEAGLQSGDIIVEFNGQAISDSRQLRLLVAHNPPGAKVAVKALRLGKPKTFTVTLKELPQSISARGGTMPEDSEAEVLKDVSVSDLTPNARRQFNIPDEIVGALVTSVAPDSVAYEVGLRIGDVIQEVNRKPVRTAAEVIAATREISSQRVLLRVWSQGSSRYLVVDEGGQP